MTRAHNLDDVLANPNLPSQHKNQHPDSPEKKIMDEYSTADLPEKTNVVEIKPDIDKPLIAKKEKESPITNPKKSEKTEIDKPVSETKDDKYDDYGNEKPTTASKTYTEEEVNARINQAVRERFDRFEKNKQIIPPQAPNQTQSLPEQQKNIEGEDWSNQLEAFVRQTNEKISKEAAIRAQQEQEIKAHQEFEAKFHSGMAKFPDFMNVVSSQPFSDAMTIATRGMKDPAAFVYAASKRHAEDIKRISQINDPYIQMTEIGKLEERMRKSQSATNAPKPVRTIKEDATIEDAEPAPKTVEDMLRESDARRLASKTRRRR